MNQEAETTSAILVPEERIGVLKAAREFREKIEKELGAKISIDGNSVQISGEGFGVWQARSIVRAIGRGFSPQKAERLFDENEELVVIELKEFGDKRMEAIKARVIGAGGKTRYMIEEFTGASVSVYGKTISLIGAPEQIKNAKEAVVMFMNGSMHATVYRFLERLGKNF